MSFNHIVKKVKRFATWLILPAAMVCGSAVAEEVRYVSDKLTLKMYKDASLSKSLPSLKSGDQVTVLKQDDGYSQVEKIDGTIGWVKTSYLEQDKPAAMRLAEVQKELDDLRSKHTDLLIEQPVAQEPQNDDLMARVAAAESSQHNMKQRLKELEAERMSLTDKLRNVRQQSGGSIQSDESRQMLLWILLPILTLITGFFVGLKFIEGKIKARFGGFNPL